VSRYQKGKTNLDFTEARDSEWWWHQLAICKSAPRSTTQIFTGQMPFLPPNQQHQSTEGTCVGEVKKKRQSTEVVVVVVDLCDYRSVYRRRPYVMKPMIMQLATTLHGSMKTPDITNKQ